MWFFSGDQIDGLVQDCSISIANALEILQSYTKRLTFTNESMGKVDRSNGFIGGSRTSDNIFILQGLVQRQMIIGESLFVCFIDFSKAFDLVSRHILFYKILKGGWTGRVIDTLRSLYSKTHYRVKRGGKLSPMIPSLTGVNQEGAASGILFRKYLQDLYEYLKNILRPHLQVWIHP